MYTIGHLSIFFSPQASVDEQTVFAGRGPLSIIRYRGARPARR